MYWWCKFTFKNSMVIGQTPLHYAVSWNSLEATRALVRGGANVGLTCRDRIYYINKTIPVCVVGGRTPLHIAAEKVKAPSVCAVVCWC